MARRPRTSRVNDPRLPTLDDDFETLVKKANAYFKEKRQSNETPSEPARAPMTREELLQRIPRNRQQMPERTPTRRGLMRRDS